MSCTADTAKMSSMRWTWLPRNWGNLQELGKSSPPTPVKACHVTQKSRQNAEKEDTDAAVIKVVIAGA